MTCSRLFLTGAFTLSLSAKQALREMVVVLCSYAVAWSTVVWCSRSVKLTGTYAGYLAYLFEKMNALKASRPATVVANRSSNQRKPLKLSLFGVFLSGAGYSFLSSGCRADGAP